MDLYKIYIVVDAGTEIGMGHLSRCTAFYDSFTSMGVKVEYLLDSEMDCSSFIDSRICHYVQWHRDVNILANYVTKDDYIFLDSLHITQYQGEIISSICKKLIVIDDYLRLNYTNAIILDWTPNVENTGKHDKNLGRNIHLLGVGYVVLRYPFSAYHYEYDSLKDSNLEILVVMGGTDIRNLTYVISNALQSAYPDCLVKIVDGKTNSVDAYTMFKLMKDADVVVTAAGQTLFELFKLRKATIPIQVIDNQIEDIVGMQQLGLYDEYFLWDDPMLIAKIIKRVGYLANIDNRAEALSKMKIIDFKDTPREVINILNENSN